MGRGGTTGRSSRCRDPCDEDRWQRRDRYGCCMGAADASEWMTRRTRISRNRGSAWPPAGVGEPAGWCLAKGMRQPLRRGHLDTLAP